MVSSRVIQLGVLNRSALPLLLPHDADDYIVPPLVPRGADSHLIPPLAPLDSDDCLFSSLFL